MQNPPLPAINWKSIGPDPNNTPGYKDVDEYGNEWFMSENQERIILKTHDGRHFEAWTVQDCWNHYIEEGVELNYQTLLVDALQFAWTQAEKAGLLAKSDRFRAVWELARDGKIGQTEELRQQIGRQYNEACLRLLGNIQKEVAERGLSME